MDLEKLKEIFYNNEWDFKDSEDIKKAFKNIEDKKASEDDYELINEVIYDLEEMEKEGLIK